MTSEYIPSHQRTCVEYSLTLRGFRVLAGFLYVGCDAELSIRL